MLFGFVLGGLVWEEVGRRWNGGVILRWIEILVVVVVEEVTETELVERANSCHLLRFLEVEVEEMRMRVSDQEEGEWCNVARVESKLDQY